LSFCPFSFDHWCCLFFFDLRLQITIWYCHTFLTFRSQALVARNYNPLFEISAYMFIFNKISLFLNSFIFFFPDFNLFVFIFIQCYANSESHVSTLSIYIYIYILIIHIYRGDTCKKSLKYQRGNQNPYIEEKQTAQSPKEKAQKDKQRSTRYTYKTKVRGTRTPLKTGGELRCSVPAPLVTPVVLI